MLLEKELKIKCEKDLIEFSENYLKNKGYDLNNVKSEEQITDFYYIVLPCVVYDYFCNLKDKEKYDVLLIDNGIELKGSWTKAVNSMIKKRGKIIVNVFS